jgi:hypothetical protein
LYRWVTLVGTNLRGSHLVPAGVTSRY